MPDAISSHPKRGRLPITASLRHQSPSDPRELVGERNSRNLRRPPCQQCHKPGPMLGPMDFGIADDGERSGREQATQIAIPSFADVAKLVLASARILLRNQADQAEKSRPDRKALGSAMLDDFANRCVVVAQQLGGGFTKAREAAQIAEQRGNLAALTFKLLLRPGSDDQIGYLRRKETCSLLIRSISLTWSATRRSSCWFSLLRSSSKRVFSMTMTACAAKFLTSSIEPSRMLHCSIMVLRCKQIGCCGIWYTLYWNEGGATVSQPEKVHVQDHFRCSSAVDHPARPSPRFD
jgi:hypothetical protein